MYLNRACSHGQHMQDRMLALQDTISIIWLSPGFCRSLGQRVALLHFQPIYLEILQVGLPWPSRAFFLHFWSEERPGAVK